MMHTMERSDPWNKGKAWVGASRARAWEQARRLAEQHGLLLVDCIRHMVPSEEEQAVLILRGIGKVLLSYERIAVRRGVDLQAIEVMEARGLLHLLSRLCEYDAHVSAERRGEAKAAVLAQHREGIACQGNEV